MKVLFLDIDGVLNSFSYFSAEKLSRAAFRHAPSKIDARAVARLNFVVEQCEAIVVLSSDWRKSPPNPGLLGTEAALRERGATFSLTFATPILKESERLARLAESSAGTYTPRWLEIQCWLDEHQEVSRFAIVDDEPDMAHLNDRLVVTEPEFGLTDDNCGRLLALLQ